MAEVIGGSCLCGSVRFGVLDGDPGIRPQERTFVASKAPWDEIKDDLPQHPGPRPGK